MLIVQCLEGLLQLEIDWRPADKSGVTVRNNSKCRGVRAAVMGRARGCFQVS